MLRTTIVNIDVTPAQFPETMEIDIRGLDDKRKVVELSGMTSGDTIIINNFLSTLTNSVNQIDDIYSANTYINLYVKSSTIPTIFSGTNETTISTYGSPEQVNINDFINMIKTI